MKTTKVNPAILRAERFIEDMKQAVFIKVEPYHRKFELVLKWTTSKGRDSYGYNVVSLFVDGKKVSSCNGGGYDMEGTVIGSWLQKAFEDRLYKMIDQKFSGLSFHDPMFNVYEQKLERADGTFTDADDVGKTFRQLKEEGKVVDLEIHRQWYKASSPTPTERHIYAMLDGAAGKESMMAVAEKIGLKFEWLSHSQRFKNNNFYTVYDYVKREDLK